MFRTLPRLAAFALTMCAYLHATTIPAAAQTPVPSTTFMATAAVAPGALTSTVLFPAAPLAASTAAPSSPIVRSDFSSGRRPSLLPALYATTIALQALDAHSTMKALDNGATEANPMMQGVVGNRGALLAVKAGAAAATIYLAEKMWRRNRVAAVAMMVVLNGVSAAIVTHNYQVAQRLR